MQVLTPNWKIALQISWYHTRTANRITGSLILLSIIIAVIVLTLTGHPLSLALYMSYFLHYRGIIVALILIIHFIPVNLYAIIKVLKHEYYRFRLLVIEKQPHETDNRYHQTL